MSNPIIAHIYILIASLLIALSFLATSELAGVLDPISLTLYRFVFAGAVLLPIMLFKWSELIDALKLVPKALVVSLFYSFYFIAMFKSLESTTILNTGTIYTLVPLMTASLCIVFCRESIGLTQFLVYLLGLLATVIVIFKADINLLLGLALNTGDAFFFLGALAMAIYPITLKFMYPPQTTMLAMVFTTLLGGIFWMSVFVFAWDIPLGWQAIQGHLWYNMIYLSIGTTIITLYLYQAGIVVLGPKKAMAYVYLNPAIVAVASYVIYGYTLNMGVAVGILLSCLATVWILRMPVVQQPARD